MKSKILKRMLSFMVTVLMVIPTLAYLASDLVVNAKEQQDTISIAEGKKLGECFPDPEFRSYIYNEIINTTQSYVSYGLKFEEYPLSLNDVSKIKKVTSLKFEHKESLTDLTGIQNFEALKSLDCYQTGITSLDVSNNKNLTELTCSDNSNLTNINVSGASSLTNFKCHNNKGLKTLDVSKNTSLQTLWCMNTGITNLDVSNNENLEILNCYNCSNLATINISGARALKVLACMNTGVTKLDLKQNLNLIDFRCDGTKITDLDISHNSQLTHFTCNDTSITNLDVSANKKLKYLGCSRTGITSLDVTHNLMLEILDCNKTGITSLDVSNNHNLYVLNCKETKMKKLDLANTSVNLQFYHYGSCISDQKPDFKYVKTADGRYKILEIPMNGKVKDLKINNKVYTGSLTSDIIVDSIPEKISYNYDTSLKGGSFIDVTSNSLHEAM